MPNTARGPADFEIKDYEGTHWVLINVQDSDFPALEGGWAGLDIKAGTPHEKIQELTKMLRELVTSFHITTDLH